MTSDMLVEQARAYYLITSGKPLQLVKQYIKDRQRVRDENCKLVKELRANRWVEGLDGRLAGVAFIGKVPSDWLRPNSRGMCLPRKKSEWGKRLSEQKGYRLVMSILSTDLGIPMSYSYDTKEGETGFVGMGNPFNEAGFLWLFVNGPFAMYIPDIAVIVKAARKSGKIVKAPASTFSMTIPGCKRIEKEEWDILVAQHALRKKRKSA